MFKVPPTPMRIVVEGGISLLAVVVTVPPAITKS